MVKSIRYLAPNAVTAANIAAGFFSMIAATQGAYELSVYLLVLAITLDTLDGAIARLLGATSKFGQEMDSICDALSFAAAPALLIYLACLHKLGGLGMVLSLLYLLAGALRLARFNLISDVHNKERKILGAPTPIAASYLMASVLMRDRLSAELVAAVTVFMAIMMVSRVALPTLKGKNLVTAMLLVGILNYFAVAIWPGWYTIAWWNIWNVVILLAAWAQDRRLATPPLSV